MIAIAALGIVVSGDLVRLLFGVADMDESVLAATAAALGVFLLGLTAHSLITVLARSFYALKDTATPVAAALVAVAANIIIANLLIGPLGLNGLAAAIAISAWLEALVLVILLLRRVPAIRPGMGHVGVVMAKTVLVSFAGALVAYAVDQALVGAWGTDPGFLLVLVRISLAVAAGGLVIVAGSLALRIDELRAIVGVMTDLVRRRGRA
jgi:putative peptidoglycan lipid II flippase